MICVNVSGNPGISINLSLTDKLQIHQGMDFQSLAVIYTNSKTNTEGPLLLSATKISEKLHLPHTEPTFADSLTGGNVIKCNTGIMAVVKNYTKHIIRKQK